MSDNPYAAPRSEELLTRSTIDRQQALMTRVQFRSAERLVRSIGLVYYVQALLVVIVCFMLLTGGVGDPPSVLSAAVYCFILSLVLMVAGYGLRLLTGWSRLLALLQTFYLLAGFMFGLYALTVDGRTGFIFAVLHALPFYVLFSPRAGYVLSREYADIIAATPGHDPGTWPLAFFILALLCGLVGIDYFFFTGL